MSSSESGYPESPAIYLFATLSMVFIVLDTSYGFAGNGGYLRAFGDETALKQGHPPGGWKFARPLGGGWYAVGQH